MILQELIVPLLMDSSKFDSGIDNAVSKSESLSSGLAKVGGFVFGGAVAGLSLLAAGLFSSTAGAMDAEMVQADLNATLASTNGIAGMTADSVNALSESLSKVTLFEDDVITAGQNMLLTFTGIGKDVFPQATEAMLNMATKMGADPVDMAMMLGKALNSPADGLSALTRNGIVFTAEQENQIKAMQEAGDVAGAQAIILGELEKEFGGVAIAAGNTSKGSLIKFSNMIGNIKDRIGGAVLPALSTFGTTLMGVFDKPQVKKGIDDLVTGIGNIANQAVLYLPIIIDNFFMFASWLSNNQGVIVGVLAALGVAVLAFGVSVATATWTALAPMLPVIAVMALVGLAAYALYQVWTTNFGGIQEKVRAVWDYLSPTFESIRTWLGVNIPIAIKTVSDFWANTLVPAMKLAWDFIQTYLFPLFKAVGEFISVSFSIYIKELAKNWDSVYNAVKKVVDWMQKNVIPILTPIGNFIGGAFAEKFEKLKSIISSITVFIRNMTDALKEFNDTPVNVPAEAEAQANGIGASNIPANLTTSSGLAYGNSTQQVNTTNAVIDEERLARLIVSGIMQGLGAR